MREEVITNSGKHIQMNKIIINTIVDKIIAGEKKWLPEELQFQKNYPELIEIELKKRQMHVPIRCKDDSYFIVPYNWTAEKIGTAKKIFGFERCISAPQCVALALFSNLYISGIICIITDDGEFCEICIIDIDDGVFQVMYTTWAQSSKVNSSFIFSSVQLAIKIELIGQVIYVADNTSLSNYFNFTSCFGKPILRLSNITDVCNLGISVCKKITQGLLKDILLLDVVTQTMYVQTPIGNIFELIESNTTIPTRKSEIIDVCGVDTDCNIAIRQGNNPIADKNPIIAVLNLDTLLTNRNTLQKIEVTIDVDARMCACIIVMDRQTGKTIRAKLG